MTIEKLKEAVEKRIKLKDYSIYSSIKKVELQWILDLIDNNKCNICKNDFDDCICMDIKRR